MLEAIRLNATIIALNDLVFKAVNCNLWQILFAVTSTLDL